MFCNRFVHAVIKHFLSRIPTNLVAFNHCKYSKVLSTSINRHNSTSCIERIVSPFCGITVHSACCNVNIKPTDPEEYKNSDKLIAQFNASHKDIGFHIDQSDKDRVTVNIHSISKTSETLGDCFLQVPVQSNIEVFCHGKSNVQIHDMQAEKVLISCDIGSINTKNIRGSTIELLSNGGNIHCKGVLQGNIKLSTLKHGMIECQRLQGRSAQVMTEAGHVNLSSCYTDKSQVTTTSGNICLENLHRNCDILTGSGNLTVSGFDGCMKAHLTSGNADIQISQLQSDSSVETSRGDVKIRLTDSTDCHLSLLGNKIVIPSSFKNNEDVLVIKSLHSCNFLNGNNNSAHVLKVLSNKGTVELIKASWISTLNLGKKVKTADK